MRRVVSNLVLFACVALGFGALLWVSAWVVRPELGEKRFAYTQQEIAETEKARKAAFDPNHLPSLHVKQMVKARAESPILAALVSEGKLPPLSERVPEEPIVMTGEDGGGKYGGTWLRLAGNVPDVETINYRLSGCFLARWSPLGYPIEPHLAKSIEASEDKRVWTVRLRKGIRWSDGEQFTAADIMYWWDEEANNPYLY